MKLMANAAKGLMLAAFMAVATTTVNAQNESAETFAPVKVGDWVKGEEVTGNGQEVYIYNVGAGTFISGKTATETDITKAYSWNVNGTSTYTFACSNGNRISMKPTVGIWSAEIKDKSGATEISLVSATTTDKGYCYNLSATGSTYIKPFKYEEQTRYFTVSGTNYEATATATTNSDWLFISTKQKDAYVEYTKSFNDLDGYLKNEKVVKETTLLDKIKEILAQVSSANHSFDTYEGDNGDKVTLANIIKEVEDFLNATTGIETIKPANGNAETAAIYDVNGVRQNSLSKGINIVKMSDGTVKKVIKK